MFRSFAAMALLLVSACQLPGSVRGCSNVQVDWVDFIQVGTAQYIAGSGTPLTLQENDLGPVVARVKFRVAGNVCDPSYKPKAKPFDGGRGSRFNSVVTAIAATYQRAHHTGP